MTHAPLDDREVLVAEDRGAVRILRLNRPERRNALSAALCNAIDRALDAGAADEDVRAVVLTGAGTAFSAGFDLNEMSDAEQQRNLVGASGRYHRTVWSFPKPIVCAVNGPALAGGFDLTTLCDLRIAGRSATFGHPEIKFGMPPLYTPLRWLVGDGIARDLCLTGRTLSPDDARRMGLVSRVCADEDLLAEAVDMASAVATAPAETLAAFKRYASGVEGTFEASFSAEHDAPFGMLLEGRGDAVVHASAGRLDELHRGTVM